MLGWDAKAARRSKPPERLAGSWIRIVVADRVGDEADGWIAHGAKKDDVALADVRTAVALEDSTEKHAVTPGPIVPAHEMLGDLLVATGQHGLALAEYEASLHISPNRFHALAGAVHAAFLSGDKVKARTYYTQLVVVAKHADPDVAPITEAKAFLAAN